jgi:hypothetical protein
MNGTAMLFPMSDVDAVGDVANRAGTLVGSVCGRKVSRRESSEGTLKGTIVEEE